MVRLSLVSGLLESLAPLPRSPASPCTPCVEGRQCATPHSSFFPPTTAPFQTLHLDVNVPTALEPWLLARGDAQALCGFLLHSDRGVRYAVHQLNLWPSDARPQVTSVFLWTGSPGVAADFRIWGSLALVCAPGANKLSPRTRAFVFLGFPLDTSGWQFYNPVTYQFFSSQDPPPPPPPLRPALSDMSHVTSRSSPLQSPVPVVSGGVGGVAMEGVGTGAAGARGDGSGGVGGVRGETTLEEDTAVSTQRPHPASPPSFPSFLQFLPCSPPWPVTAEPGGVPAGSTRGLGGVVGRGSGAGVAGAGDTSTTTPTPHTVRFLTRVQRLDRLKREERERVEEDFRPQQQVQLRPQEERVEEESRPQQQVHLRSQQERVEEDSRPLQQVQLRPQQEKGPAPRLGPKGGHYFLVVVDDFSRYITVFPLAKKSEVTFTLIWRILATEGTHGSRVRCLHSDCGGEFRSNGIHQPVFGPVFRTDLAYPLSLLACYMAPGRHRKVHRDAAKRVLRYLCSTSGIGLVLGGRGPVVLTGHADASSVDNSATQRSSQGYTFSFGSGSVSWRSTHSSSVLSSSCEAEIYARTMAAQELRWLTYLLTDLGKQPRSPLVLYVDNKAMIALCQEHRLEHRTKRIAMRYFLARELQQRGQLRLA
ncbi:unnamed protein product [Closterium sp. NIES-53]